MRILHLIPGNLYGGVETFASLLARRTDLAGDLQHHFAICFDGRLSRELESIAAPVHRLGAMRASRPWTVRRGRANLRKLLDEIRFDLSVCHSSWPQAMFAPVLEHRGVANIFYLHGPITRVSWVDRLAARTSPRMMIAVSQHAMKTGWRIFPRTTARVLHYPLPTTISPATSHGDDVVLIAVSRMDAWKGHAQLIDAVAQLRDVGNWSLQIAGGAQRPREQNYLRDLRNRVASHRLGDRVKFLGERDDVPQILSHADVFCQANTSPEGFSIAFMEAFAARLPIVTTRLGGAMELIDGSCGMLIPPGDVAALSSAIHKLIVDRPLRKKMGNAGAARVRDLCDPAARLNELREMFESAHRMN